MIDEENNRGQRPGLLLPWALTVAAVMFAVGLLLSPWFETNVRTRLPGALHRPDVGSVAAQVEQQSSALASLDTRVRTLEARPAAAAAPMPGEQPALNDPGAAGTAVASALPSGVTDRIAAVERNEAQQTTRIDNLSAEIAGLNARIGSLGNDAAQSMQSAAESAEKARGVLLVTTARRAAEQGQSLAVLEPALRRYFGADNAQAVDHLLTASRSAPTLDVLRASFARLRPVLLGGDRNQGGGWWDRFVAGISDVVSVRRTEGDANARRIAEMNTRLQRGDVAGALVILRRLPPATQRLAREWHDSAEAYADVADALQQLEAAVLLEDEDLPLAAPVAEVPPKSTL